MVFDYDNAAAGSFHIVFDAETDRYSIEWKGHGFYSGSRAAVENAISRKYGAKCIRDRYRDVTEGDSDSRADIAEFRKLPLLAQAIVTADFSPWFVFDSIEDYYRSLYV